MYRSIEQFTPLLDAQLVIQEPQIIEDLIEKIGSVERRRLYELSNGDTKNVVPGHLYYGDIFDHEYEAFIFLLGNDGQIILHKNTLDRLVRPLTNLLDNGHIHTGIIIASEYIYPINVLPKDTFSIEIIPNGCLIMFDYLDNTNPFLRIGPYWGNL